MSARIAALALAIALVGPCAPAAALRVRRHERGPIHVVQPGETLWTIAKEDYGKTAAWEAIYQLNRKAIGPDPRHVCAGIVLRLPSSRQIVGSSGGRPDRKRAVSRASLATAPASPSGVASASRNPFAFVGRPAAAHTAAVASPGRNPFEFGR